MASCGTSTGICANPQLNPSYPIQESMGFCRPEWGTTTNGVFNIGGLKRKFRWLFNISNITTSVYETNQPLPCMKAARPKITLRKCKQSI